MFIAHAPARAETVTATYSATLSVSALQPGQTAVLAVVLDVQRGLHAQSHKPLQPSLIPLEVEPGANPAVEFLDPIYPTPEMKMFLGLGTQSVYTGKVVVYIPLRVKADAAPGDTTLEGTITWQACNDKVCFRPERKKPFSVATKIVPASQAVSLQDQSLFSGFDQSVFSKGAAPTSQPAADIAAPPPSSTTIDFFGHTFSLGASNVGLAMVVALAVGVLFNLMPCVLPVLPLKVIGFVEASQHSRARCLLLGSAFSLGVIAFFAVLAQLVVVSRFLQWGQLFSYGWFIWLIVIILVGLTLSMFGLFEVILPSKVYELTPGHESVLSNFGFGIFTAILSSPCVAPMFAGTLAWALAQPTAVGIAAFLMVGVGMALPYLLLSAFPNLVKWVPRSGPWSAVLKQTMAFFVLAVAVYFAAGRLVSRRECFYAIFFVVAIGMIFFVARTAQLTRRPRPIAIAFAVAAVVILIAFNITQRLTGGLEWKPFTPDALAQARASGKPVLVEFTANWCGNCLALEASVYHDPAAAAAIHQRDVTLLRADLTDEDAPGWKVVNQLNPGGGIPLTAIYGSAQSDPIKLTSLYTTRNLIDALDRAVPRG